MKKKLSKKRLRADVTKKAEALLKKLKAGQHWSRIGGHKLHDAVAFELPGRHRLLCWFEENEGLKKREAMTHEDYNKYASNTRR